MVLIQPVGGAFGLVPAWIVRATVGQVELRLVYTKQRGAGSVRLLVRGSRQDFSKLGCMLIHLSCNRLYCSKQYKWGRVAKAQLSKSEPTVQAVVEVAKPSVEPNMLDALVQPSQWKSANEGPPGANSTKDVPSGAT